jgi:hypothetical protein
MLSRTPNAVISKENFGGKVTLEDVLICLYIIIPQYKALNNNNNNS